MPPAGFEPIIPASERPQTHTLDRAATGIDCSIIRVLKTSITNVTGRNSPVISVEVTGPDRSWKQANPMEILLTLPPYL
jgi:hypothetical protein